MTSWTWTWPRTRNRAGVQAPDVGIKTEIDHSRRLTRHLVEGIPTLAELEAAVQLAWETNPYPNIFWDLTAGGLEGLTTQDVHRFARFIRQNQPRWAGRSGGRTAVAAPRELSYGIGRMLGIVLEALGANRYVDVRIFRSAPEALAWLDQGAGGG